MKDYGIRRDGDAAVVGPVAKGVSGVKRDPCPFCGDVAGELFDLVVDAAKEADEKAQIACQRSKYSVQDYWMCVEMRMATLADKIARKHYLSMRCPIFPFRMALNEFRKSRIKLLTFELEPWRNEKEKI